KDIAEEWIAQTFCTDKEFVQKVESIMMDSREAVVNYMMPLGLHHLFAWTHHYGPEPWCEIPGARADWLPSYYHKASEDGIGFDRSSKGTNAVSQYHEPLSTQFDNVSTCPDEYLLWFHHLPWDYKMQNGETLWSALCHKYDKGVKQVRNYQVVWDGLEKYVDADRFKHVQSKLRRQAHDAVWWRDACLLYFQQYSKMPLPSDVERPVKDLDEYKQIKFRWSHHN
ncbi:MAG: alpha-glucuronidase, partial [Bacteroidaceae bacterium]|nr:alpha-glucuronidase [Bacteroidaceae bacterium]